MITPGRTYNISPDGQWFLMIKEGPGTADAAIESAMLAPNGQLSMYPWKDTPEKIPLAVRHVRSFLLSHRPA